MSENEILALVVGGVAGYWGVLKWLGRTRSGSQNKANPPKGKSGSDSGSNSSGDERTPFGDSKPVEDGASGVPNREPRAAVPWWSVLQVDRFASSEDIQRAYKKLMSQYHPDKVASLGEDLRAVAESKSKEINGAYAEAMRGRK